MKSKISLYLLIFIIFYSIKDINASGMNLHYMMSKKAVLASSGSLHEFLKEYYNAILSGTVFPDTGFVFKNEYGHQAHSPQFFNTYAQYLNERCQFPLNHYCRYLTAHFFGSVAHEVQDNNFDRYFVTKVAQLEFSNDLGKAQKYTDSTMDFVAIFKDRLWSTMPKGFYLPKKEISEIFSRIGLNYSPSALIRRASLHYAGTIGMRIGSPFVYLAKRKISPWAVNNYRCAKGGINDTSRIVLAMWEKMWARLERDKSFNGLSSFYNLGGWPYNQFGLE